MGAPWWYTYYGSLPCVPWECSIRDWTLSCVLQSLLVIVTWGKWATPSCNWSLSWTRASELRKCSWVSLNVLSQQHHSSFPGRGGNKATSLPPTHLPPYPSVPLPTHPPPSVLLPTHPPTHPPTPTCPSTNPPTHTMFHYLSKVKFSLKNRKEY